MIIGMYASRKQEYDFDDIIKDAFRVRMHLMQVPNDEAEDFIEAGFACGKKFLAILNET